MILIILIAILVLAIAYFQVAQGLFSAFIMTFLSVLTALVAVSYYEQLAQYVMTTLDSRNAAIVEPASLIALFVVPLLALRFAFDKFLPSNMVFGQWGDRIGGGVLGLVTGIICAGVLTLALQMLPYGRSILGYMPYDNNMARKHTFAPFYPDDFVLGMVQKFSTGSLAGKQPFGATHGNVPLQLFAQRYAGYLNGAVIDKAGAMTLKGVYKVPAKSSDAWVKELTETAHVLPEGVDTDIYVVRASVNNDLKDKDGWLRVPIVNFRMTTRVNGELRDYCPLAYLTYKTDDGKAPSWQAMIQWPETGSEVPNILNTTIQRQPKGQLIVDLVYALPQDEQPSTVAFRRLTKVAVKEVGEWDGSDMQADALERKSGK